jgi:hypothetical protein
MENTDAEGRFRLKNCEPEAPIRISVRRKSTFDELAVEHVVPGSDELLLQLPKEAWIHIRGVIVDPDGKPLANVHVSPFKKGGNGSPADTNDATTGAFDLGPYPPGDYSLRLAADGFPTVNFPLRTVGPDAVWDVGTVQMQRGGFAAVTLLHPEGQPLPALSLYLYESNGAHRSQLELQDGRGQSGPLVPGDYLLQVSVRDMACLQQPFSIRAGVTTPVDVVLQRGAAVEIEVALPATATPASIDVVVSNAAGAVVMRGTAWSRSGPSKLSISLLPGSYRIAASTAGAAGDTTLEVTAAGPNRARVALSLR